MPNHCARIERREGKGLEKEKTMKKNDWLLLIVILLTAALIFFIRYFVGDEHPGYVTVRVGGEITETYDLSEDQTVKINGGTNVMKIEDKTVNMIDANCPDKLCVHQKTISKNNESIICLPNNVVVQIVSQDESELDAVTN